MRVDELLHGVEIIENSANTTASVSNIVFDSRKVQNGDIFVALRGEKADGHNFVDDAVKNGALCIVTEKPVDSPYVLVRDTRKALALMAANFYGNSHRRLEIITVAGTNGKTTTTYILNEILKACGRKTAVIGTLGAWILDKKMKTDLTTPDPLELHRLFAEAEKSGTKYVIMEASAHAIYYRKLEGITATVGVFTNISQDHLDFFGTMEKYSKVKTDYFDSVNMKVGIINGDDIYGRKIIRSNKLLCLSYGIDSPADIFAVDFKSHGEKTSFIANVLDDLAEITMPLIGKFNLYNTLAAIATCKALSVPLEVIGESLEKMKEVEGRFNIIKTDITVIIDYAHTPDGLENLLKAARELDGGKVITVFGCGGNRDAAKRPIMGKIAGEYSDFCVITSDNPRMEQPMDIIAQIEEGMKRISQEYMCIQDRSNAIAYAIGFAQKGDKVVVAGKGGENYLDIMGEKIPYSDKEAVESALGRRA